MALAATSGIGLLAAMPVYTSYKEMFQDNDIMLPQTLAACVTLCDLSLFSCQNTGHSFLRSTRPSFTSPVWNPHLLQPQALQALLALLPAPLRRPLRRLSGTAMSAASVAKKHAPETSVVEAVRGATGAWRPGGEQL